MCEPKKKHEDLISFYHPQALQQLKSVKVLIPFQHTADGKNPATVDMVDIPQFTELHTCPVVVWDFFHPQYFAGPDPIESPQPSEFPRSPRRSPPDFC